MSDLSILTESEKVNQLISNLTQFLESFDPDGDVMETNISNELRPGDAIGDDKLMEELKQIYDPVLTQHGFTEELKDQILEAMAEENILVENNIIRLDNDTKRAQLNSLCALLISRQSNSPDYQAYKEASKVKKTMKLKIQTDNQAAAKALADRYLKQTAVSASNPTVRNAAEALG